MVSTFCSLSLCHWSYQHSIQMVCQFIHSLSWIYRSFHFIESKYLVGELVLSMIFFLIMSFATFTTCSLKLGRCHRFIGPEISQLSMHSSVFGSQRALNWLSDPKASYYAELVWWWHKMSRFMGQDLRFVELWMSKLIQFLEIIIHPTNSNLHIAQGKA